MNADFTPPRPWLASYGPSQAAELPPLPYDNLAHLVSHACQSHARKNAFTTVMPNGMNGTLSFAQIGAMSDAFAAYLRHDCGLVAGDRVAVQLVNGLAYPIVAFGIFKAGCVLVNMNPLYTPDEMIHQITDAGAKVLILTDIFADKLTKTVPQTGIERVVLAGVSDFFPAIPRGIIRAVQKVWHKNLPPVPKTRAVTERLSAALRRGRGHGGADIAQYWQNLTRDDLALLQYTGGTTGVAKGAMLTHGNILANLAQVQAVGGDLIGEKETVLTALPLYHIFAFTANLMAFFEVGARNILIPSPRPVQNLQRAIENYPITWITGVNTLFNALMNEEWFAAYPPKKLRAAIAGGTALHQAVAKRWQAMTGTPIGEGYGLTETAPVVSFNPLDARAKDGSIGIPVPQTDVILVDEAGKPVPFGTPGEILVKGPQVMQGYWQNPSETARAMPNGWFATGDVAVMDEDGFLRIVDRKKDIVIVSGFNVYPNEIEAVLAQMEAVLEAAVIAIPDATTGEAVRAYVVKNPDYAGDLTPEAILVHCRDHLTGYKLPRSIILRDELPKSPIGKILRKDLKAEARAEFGQ